MFNQRYKRVKNESIIYLLIAHALLASHSQGRTIHQPKGRSGAFANASVDVQWICARRLHFIFKQIIGVAIWEKIRQYSISSVKIFIRDWIRK